MEQTILTTYPPLWKRFAATLLDFFIIFILGGLVSSILPNDAPNWLLAVSFTSIFLYDPICTAFFCTAGAYLMKFRVRKFENPSQKISFPMAIIRFIIKSLLGWISFLTIHRNEQRRAIHDMVANSVVINA